MSCLGREMRQRAPTPSMSQDTQGEGGGRVSLMGNRTVPKSGMSLVRCGSVTHSFDADQRIVIPRIVPLNGEEMRTTHFRIHLPDDDSVLIPGMYLAFLLSEPDEQWPHGKHYSLGRFIHIRQKGYRVYGKPPIEVFRRREG